MKRVIIFLMVLALTLSLGVSAFAAGGTGEGSITINNAVKDADYAVYKIFDATYVEGDTAVTYTIDSSNQFFTELFGTDGTTDNEYFEYHASTGVVTRKAGKTDAELFDYLEKLVEGATPTASQKAPGTTIEFDNLDTGYYVIHRPNSSSANAVTITTARPDADVNDKNELPGGDFDKSSDKDVVSVGDTITWTVKFTATNYSDEEIVMNYTVKDALNRDWAEINSSSIAITVGGNPIDKGTGWTLVSDPAKTNGFEINIPWVNTDAEGEFVSFKYPATAEVVITYSATVLDAAAANDPANPTNRNDANLSWETENIPNVPGEGDGTESDVYNLGFTKVDGTSGEGLPGAVFTLKDADGNAVPLIGGTNGTYKYNLEGTVTEIVTPTDGKVVVMGLPAGTYTLTETTAPEGYNKLTESVTIVVAADPVDDKGNVIEKKGSNITVDGTEYYVNHAQYDIQNFSGVELPSTGGKGTMMLITFGSVVAMAFAMLLITQKKMSIYRD